MKANPAAMGPEVTPGLRRYRRTDCARCTRPYRTVALKRERLSSVRLHFGRLQHGPTRSSPSAHHAISGRANPQHPQIWTYHGLVGPQVRLCRRHPVTSIGVQHCVRKTVFRLCRRHRPVLDFKAMTAVTAFSGDATNCATEVGGSVAHSVRAGRDAAVGSHPRRIVLGSHAPCSARRAPVPTRLQSNHPASKWPQLLTPPVQAIARYRLRISARRFQFSRFTRSFGTRRMCR